MSVQEKEITHYWSFISSNVLDNYIRWQKLKHCKYISTKLKFTIRGIDYS